MRQISILVVYVETVGKERRLVIQRDFLSSVKLIGVHHLPRHL